jgi:hypothetical protein
VGVIRDNYDPSRVMYAVAIIPTAAALGYLDLRPGYRHPEKRLEPPKSIRKIYSLWHN